MHWLGELFSKIGSLFNWFFVVVPWEQAIRVRMGKTITKLGPGVHFQVPFLDRVYIQNVRDRVASTTAQALTTKDGKTVTLCAGIRFEIIDIVPLYNRLHQASDTICQEVEGHFSDYIITHDVKDCAPKEVLAYVLEQTDLGQYGLNLTKIFLTDFVITKTYRLIQGGLDRYTTASLHTDQERRSLKGEY